MNIAGIVVEYNPFHNGHIYHIEKTRELTGADLLIGVCSGNYNQRGDVSVIDKFTKTEYALRYGVDLLVELPYIYTVQNAYVFASKAIEILNRLKIDELVFGSETNNLPELQKYADLEIDVTRLKQSLRDGNSYPSSYGLLAGSMYPNDILAVAYLKALKKTKIKPVSIQRTSDYDSLSLDIISSATAIRNALKKGLDVSKSTPVSFSDPVFNEDLFPLLRHILFTARKEDLADIFLVNEGIENLLVKNIAAAKSYDDLLDSCISRRYTRSRLQRTILHIVNQIRKDEVEALSRTGHIRVLGFNRKGQEYLRTIKDDVHVVTQFKNIPEDHKAIEWKTSLVYSSILKDPQAYLKKELKGPIIID